MIKKSSAGQVPQRKTFRHGDLRRVLLEAGIELAREGGPRAIVLREATRQAGVAPNAAYRHFASHEDLLQAVRASALSSLAIAIEEEIAKVKPVKHAAEVARATLRAVGTGYIKFALAEPGLFRTAFSAPGKVEGDVDAAKAGRSGLNPFQLLSSALDMMVKAGVFPSERRQGAEYLAWSAVHGFAFLVIEGPLSVVPAKHIQALTERLVVMVENGL
ncbi:TetR/AcrR family transcriptional regulator [Terriglobus saanensis]|uniref:Regulatory protein TetR n=1 Tax=Terriglobus saanensis (strain ATCC BAA-1853 / DSM 23119 / SP1PR4) TaxID=401053 RepID=E8V6J3_TERSS|nr:TetR/AcrR family transcriptional regulator [Terriglobus saanensis]ADV82732.1 regulatory protein TetR [Terriglobus saanensis SP1PR4]